MVDKKTLKQVKAETPYGDVMTMREFMSSVKRGNLIRYDGFGYLHNGQNTVEIDAMDYVCGRSYKSVVAEYPYVIWFNR